MKTIYKYTLAVTEHQNIKMHQGATILSLQMQHDNPCIWALVNPEVELETRTFLTFGTGAEVTGIENEHIGTYQLQGGNLVFHVFESFI